MDFCVNPYSADRRTEPRTTIHRATCKSAEKFGHGPKWRWFKTWEEAHAYAQTTGHPVNCCGWCRPDGPSFDAVVADLRAEFARLRKEEVARFLGVLGRGGRSPGRDGYLPSIRLPMPRAWSSTEPSPCRRPPVCGAAL